MEFNGVEMTGIYFRGKETSIGQKYQEVRGSTKLCFVSAYAFPPPGDSSIVKKGAGSTL